MRTLIQFAGALLLAVMVHAQGATTRPTLLLAASASKPGDTVLAGVRLQMADGWHIYWRNPGGPGIPTTIKWQLPPGVTAGEILWPIPEKFVQAAEDDPLSALINYGYGHEVTLLVPLKLASEVKPGALELRATVSWLECKGTCIPGSKDVTAKLTVGDTTIRSDAADALEKVQASLPKAGDGLAPRATWEKAGSGDTRPLLIEWTSALAASEPDFFPDAYETFEMATATKIVSGSGNQLKLRKLVTKTEGVWPTEISGLLVQKVNGQVQGYEVKLTIGDGSASASGAAATPSMQRSIWFYLLNAFLGGLILNIMPCVLPVIALKILGFVQQAKDSPGRVRQLGLIYALGVLVSFLGLAALVIGIKAAGQKAGWGMQFSNPQFIIVFTVLVTLVALNLFGVFEVVLGGNVMGAAGELASRHGASGAFFNGVLATLLATPCTAPFLSIALGFAFVQSAGVITLMFLTVGVGLAFPYVVLSWYPAWLKFLPKPGAWMEKFKMAMGFPMLLTAVWLAKIGPEKYGDRAWWLGVFLVLVAAAAWVFGEFVQRGHKRKAVGLVAVLALLALAYFWALESKLDWRSPVDAKLAANAPLRNAPKGYAWEKWSTAAVQDARNAGRVVVVDFTAWWCATCNAIVKPAFGKPDLTAKMKELNAAALLADHSDFPPDIAAELEKYQRAGVPLVLVYPRDANKPPIVLPDPNPVLGISHYAGLILDALKQAAH